ncbi:MAG: alkane 1-monooxygenase [Pseudomonadota bacterium]
MARATRHFTLATITPALLLAAGAIWGGVWVVLAVMYLTAMTTILDRFFHIAPPEAGYETGDTLSVLLALIHFALLPLIVWALLADHLSLLGKLALFAAAGFWFGQISNANAHELIHRTGRWLPKLGMWVYITLLFGHHTSAHVLVHHRYVGTAQDPNTSRKGEGLYRYLLRAWTGSFVQGFHAEAARLQRTDRPSWQNPYIVYVGGSVTFMLAALVFGGIGALMAYLALCLHAQLQLLMSDYVQHYGLQRALAANGKPEPVGPRHSWNSPHWFSSALMLNATRHSDHHAHPARSYPALRLPKGAPMLPRPLPLMASIALVPPLWRRIMDPRVERLENA